MHLANNNDYTFICYYGVQTTPKPRQQGNPRCSWTAPRVGYSSCFHHDNRSQLPVFRLNGSINLRCRVVLHQNFLGNSGVSLFFCLQNGFEILNLPKLKIIQHKLGSLNLNLSKKKTFSYSAPTKTTKKIEKTKHLQHFVGVFSIVSHVAPRCRKLLPQRLQAPLGAAAPLFVVLRLVATAGDVGAVGAS